MKNSDIGIIALVAAAIIGIAFLASPATAFNQPQEDGTGPYRDYVMKVAPIEPTVVTEGTLYFKTQCGHNVFTSVVTIQEVEPVTGTFVVANGRVDPAVIAQNFAAKGGARDFDIRADGTLDVQMPAGFYTATVKDGNGGQPEFVLFEIKPAYTTKIDVIGHAFSGAEAEIARIVTITSATYGHIIKVVDAPAVPAVPGTPGTPATPATGVHAQQVIVGYHHGIPQFDYEAGHVHANQVGGTPIAPNRFQHGGHTYQITGNSHDDAFMVTPGTPATPGTPGTPAIPEQFHYEGAIIDVTAQVQQAMDAGVFSIVFDNAKHPGGIFDTEGNLIVEITDPAVGQVKDVVIEYDGITVNSQEYAVINL